MPKTPRLSRGAAKLIDGKIDELFDSLKGHALGPKYGKRLYIGYRPPLSIPGIYEQAVTEEGGRFDKDLVDRLIEISNDYLDQHKATAKALVKKRIHDVLQEINDGQREASSLRGAIKTELSNIWTTVTHG